MKLPDSLSNDLRLWRVSPPPDPGFRAAVWQRIEARRRESGWPAFLRTRATALTAAAIVIVVVSGWTGHSVARSQVQADRRMLAARYLASLDVRVQAGLKESDR
jgi:hypothetical protein